MIPENIRSNDKMLKLFFFTFFCVILMVHYQCNYSPNSRYSTIDGDVDKLRQVGRSHALRFVLRSVLKLDGSASIRSPDQPYLDSSSSVFDMKRPSMAPHSIKNPPVYKKIKTIKIPK
jgi:hypothetical protein